MQLKDIPAAVSAAKLAVSAQQQNVDILNSIIHSGEVSIDVFTGIDGVGWMKTDLIAFTKIQSDKLSALIAEATTLDNLQATLQATLDQQVSGN